MTNLSASLARRKLRKISIVSIFYNERENVRYLYERVNKALAGCDVQKEYVCVENGSADDTFDLLREIADRDSSVRIVKLSRNFGYQNGYTAGIECVSPDTSAVVLIDGDVQDPPELIPEFIRMWEEGYDVVYGIRAKRIGSPIKIFFYKLYYRILTQLTEFDLPRDAGEFGLMDAKVWRCLCKMPESNRLIRGLRAWVGFRQIGIEYTRDDRLYGTTKFSVVKMFLLAADGIFSFSGMPLRLTSFIGAIMFLLSMLGIGYFFVWKFFSHVSIPGYASTNIIMLMIGGIQLICLGIIGEYIKRIYDESKSRPKYIIDEIFRSPRG
jgi:glycosyltransferase involved in cell wall biosynthesis